jgi:glycosyltransferase involved in cell wall biosynthesis
MLKFFLGGFLARRREHERAAYEQWMQGQVLTEAELAEQSNEAQKLSYRPLLSVVVPTYNTPERFFREMVESVQAQTYDNWELVIVDDASPDNGVRERIKQCAGNDTRIKYKFLKENHHIADATNEAIKYATGEFISLFDHDDILWPNALYEIARALNNGDYDMLYTDEDKVEEESGKHRDPLFKPGWNQDFLYSVNYITHLTTVRRSILDKVGGEDGDYNGAQDWELFFRVTRSIPADRVHHIPKILYSWRVHQFSTAKDLGVKPYVAKAQAAAIASDLRARGYQRYRIEQDRSYPAQWYLTFQPQARPKVSLLVDDRLNFQKMEEHIRKNASYENFEVLPLRHDVGYSQISKQLGEYLLVVDRELDIKDPTWIDTLLGDAERLDIGFVQARLAENEELENIQSLIAEPAFSLVKSMSQNTLTRHLYRTTKYDIERVQTGVFMIEKRKLEKLVTDATKPVFWHEASASAGRSGYRNLYNPYITVVK